MPCCCFPPTAKALTTNGYVHLKDLTRNDKLLIVNKKEKIEETAFVTYLHYDSQLTAEYLVIQCDNGHKIIVSEYHLIFKAFQHLAKPVPALTICIGDLLVFVEENCKISYPKVVNITRKAIEGAFAPLTNKGTLIVDGFKASCYAEVSSHKLAHLSMAPLRTWYRRANFLLRKDGRIEDGDSPAAHGIHGYAGMLTAIRCALKFV